MSADVMDLRVSPVSPAESKSGEMAQASASLSRAIWSELLTRLKQSPPKMHEYSIEPDALFDQKAVPVKPANEPDDVAVPNAEITQDEQIDRHCALDKFAAASFCAVAFESRNHLEYDAAKDLFSESKLDTLEKEVKSLTSFFLEYRPIKDGIGDAPTRGEDSAEKKALSLTEQREVFWTKLVQLEMSVGNTTQLSHITDTLPPSPYMVQVKALSYLNHLGGALLMHSFPQPSCASLSVSLGDLRLAQTAWCLSHADALEKRLGGLWKRLFTRSGPSGFMIARSAHEFVSRMLLWVLLSCDDTFLPDSGTRQLKSGGHTIGDSALDPRGHRSYHSYLEAYLRCLRRTLTSPEYSRAAAKLITPQMQAQQQRRDVYAALEKRLYERFPHWDPKHHLKSLCETSRASAAHLAETKTLVSLIKERAAEHRKLSGVVDKVGTWTERAAALPEKLEQLNTSIATFQERASEQAVRLRAMLEKMREAS